MNYKIIEYMLTVQYKLSSVLQLEWIIMFAILWCIIIPSWKIL